MLTDDERRIREVVRFDLFASSNWFAPALIDLAEEYASNLVVEPKLSIDTFLLNQVGSLSQNRRPLRHGKKTDVGSVGLCRHLSAVHCHAMGKRDPLHGGSQPVRARLRQEFVTVDLVTKSAPPMSLIFAGHRNDYQKRCADVEELALLIGLAIDGSLSIAQRLIVDAAQVHQRWNMKLKSKPGTVLESCVRQVLGSPLVTSALMLGVTGANKSNVYRAFDALEEIQAIEEISGQKKNRVWVAREICDLLSEAVKRGARVRLPD